MFASCFSFVFDTHTHAERDALEHIVHLIEDVGGGDMHHLDADALKALVAAFGERFGRVLLVDHDRHAELVAIESFQIAQLSRCLKELDAIKETNANGSMLDHTIVLFGSGMGYGGTHSNRNLPILVAGGGFEHLGHVDTRDSGGDNMPLCNLFVTLLKHFGIERDSFNTSTGAFEFGRA